MPSFVAISIKNIPNDMELILLIIYWSIFAASFFGFTLTTGFIIGLWYGQYYYDKSENTGSRKWIWLKSILSSCVWIIGKYMFSYKVVMRSQFDNDKLELEVKFLLNPSNKNVKVRVRDELLEEELVDNFMFAGHPHGLCPISSIIFLLLPDSIYSSSLTPFTHRSVFKWPLIRDLALWIGALDVCEENIVRTLVTESIYIVPGGTREILNSYNDTIQTTHTGFLRVAFNQKKRVYPVIHYGQDKVFLTWKSHYLDVIREMIYDITSYPFPTLFLGPIPSPLTTYILDPVDPSHFKNMTEFIDFYYNQVTSNYKSISLEQEKQEEEKRNKKYTST